MNVLPTNADPDLNPASIFDPIDFSGKRSVVVAVSGGSDSLALLYLLLEFRRAQSSFPEIIAVTVDHGLRPESGDEARYVGELCTRSGISHRIVQWMGPKPKTGLSAKSREARYGLLCQAAHDAAAGIILTGHTLDDQIETFAMRSARAGEGASERGLAGMAPATLLEREIWLVRPLLEISRENLRDYLRAIGIGWRDDPSNESLKYERVRVRQALQDNDRKDILGKISEKIAQRQVLNGKVALALLSCVTIIGGIRAEIAREGWRRLDVDVQRLGVGMLLALMGGQPFLPSAVLCDKAVAFLNTGNGKTAMSRCVIECKSEKILIYREMRSIPAVTVEPGQRIVWDGRYRVSNNEVKPVEIRASGAQGVQLLKDREYIGLDFHRASALSSPALFIAGEIVYLPAFEDRAKLPEGVSMDRHHSLFDNILVGYDAALAQSVAEIFKMPAYRRSPVNQINKN
jgi:tRNA(Ile)-lysidine synthase